MSQQSHYSDSTSRPCKSEDNFTQLTCNRHNLLIEFAHRHLYFLHAELESILTMNGIEKGRDYFVIALPNESNVDGKLRSFLVLSFPLNFWKGKVIESVFSRCILVRSVVELWGMGQTLKDCVRNVRDNYELEKSDGSSGNLTSPYFSEKKSWKMTVHTFGCKFTREEQNEIRAEFSFLPFLGPVQMLNATDEYILIREIKLSFMGSPLSDELRPPCIACYFGRILGSSRNWREGRMKHLSLKRRKYLGPTSMDAELSMIMTNFAQIRKGSFCFDPFVGTGSILLTCALEGAICFGTDIDIRVLRGKEPNKNIVSNFHQYNLPRPELVRSDNSMYDRHFRNHLPLFNAVVCDPPYGIRAGARKSGSRNESVRPVLDEHRSDHIAQTKPYLVNNVMTDLLDLAAKVLVMRGRLVYIIPSMDDFDVDDLPQHPILRLISCCYQPLQTNLGRKIICMEKVGEYDESKREYYRSNIWLNGAESEKKLINIRERLAEQASQKPDYKEKAEYRRKNRRKKRREAKEEKKKKETVAENQMNLS